MSDDIKRELLEDAAKLWLAHDGLWFQAIEKKFGMEVAIELDEESWRRFSPLEAKKIIKRHDLPENGGVDELIFALKQRLYAYINEQEIVKIDENTAELRMVKCRVQVARERKGMDPFPCKSVGIIEYTTFSQTINPAFEVTCITCPPDTKPEDYYCGWRFELKS